MFFFGDSKKAKAKRRKKKKLRKKQREAFMRRTHIIIEARKKHLKNKKKTEENIGKSGVGGASDNEEKDIEAGVTVQAGKGMAWAANKRRARRDDTAGSTVVAKRRASQGTSA